MPTLMWDFIVYLGESAISLAVLYLLYKATMSYETLHRLNRVVLLGVVVLAAVLPLCEIKIIEEVELLPLADVEGDVAMMSVVEDTAFDYVAWLKSLAVALFCLGAAFMVVRLVVSQFSVWRMTRSGARRELGEGVVLTVVEKLATPFSWFRNVVVAKNDAEQDLDLILEHELAHVRLHHSWDVLAVDIALCVWWFNPALWLLRRELQSLHEYQADDAVLRKGIDAKTYQILLIKRAVGSRLHSVANCLNHSNLKNRITMMCKKTSSRWSAAKLLLVLPLVALSLAATATTVYVPKEQNKGNENFVETQTVAADEEQPYIKVQQMPTFQGGDLNAYRNWMQSQLQYPKEAKDKGIKGRVIFSFVVEKDGSVSNFDALQAPDKILVEEVERVFKLTPKWEPGKQNGKEVRVKFTVPIVFTGDDVAVYNRVFSQGTPLSEMSKDAESAAVKTQTTSAKPIGEEAFIKVESMPTFQGGDLNGYRNWFQSQLQYPAEAKEKGIKGRVIFSFVVEKDGSVSNFDALQAPDKILVDEVERVFKLTPKWEPGKQNGNAVRVKFTVPIYFKLKDAATATTVQLEVGSKAKAHFDIGLSLIKQADALQEKIDLKAYGSNTEFRSLQKEITDKYLDAVPELEKAYELAPNYKPIVETLKLLTFRLRDENGMMAKYEKYKKAFDLMN